MDIEFDSSVGPPNPSDILHDLGFFGHYLHIHAGGRGGKQFVLCALGKNGGHLTQRELLERSNTSSAALSEVLSKLEAEELITRKPSEHDRRQLDIELTPEGEVRAAHMQRHRETFEANALACLSPAEQIVLKGLLDRMVTHWKELDTKEECA